MKKSLFLIALGIAASMIVVGCGNSSQGDTSTPPATGTVGTDKPATDTDKPTTATPGAPAGTTTGKTPGATPGAPVGGGKPTGK